MVTDALFPTGVVVTEKVAVVAFAGTVTVAGTCATAVLLLESVTTAPPAGAARLNVTVPLEEVPPTTDEGLILTELTMLANTVRPVVRLVM
jgi:hypothetical protein